jgi:hypothetical protein
MKQSDLEKSLIPGRYCVADFEDVDVSYLQTMVDFYMSPFKYIHFQCQMKINISL